MKRVLLLLAALNLARLGLGFTFELSPQEAYYTFYSQHPALSYFDHPPLLAWSLWLFRQLLGHGEHAVRLTSFTLSVLTQLAFVALARRFLPEERLFRGVALFVTTLLASVLTLISTPDVPLLLFWTLSLLLLERAIFSPSPPAPSSPRNPGGEGVGRGAAWLLAGLCMGLAFDGKYTGAFLQVGLLAFLLASARHRCLLATPWPYLSVLVAHAAMLPVYVWNAQHGWASFLFQSANRAAGVGGPTPRHFLGLLATQSFLLLPPLLIGMAWFAARALPALLRGPADEGRERRHFLLSFFLPLFAPFVALSFFSLVKPNWLMPSYVSGVIFAALYVGPRLARWNYGLSAAVHVVAAVELLLYPIPIQSDDTTWGWRELARQVTELRRAHPEAFVFSADEYKTSAELIFYTGEKVYGPNVLGKRALQFDYVDPDLGGLAGRDALFLDSRPRDFAPGRSGQVPPELAARFASVEELDPILVERRGEVVRKFLVYRANRYRGPRPTSE